MPAHFKQNAKYLLTVSFLLTVLTLITFNIQNISGSKKVLGAATTYEMETQKEKGFWLKFLEENPTYIDGWVELSRLEYEEGNLSKSEEYLLKARQIDPNSEKLAQ